MTVLRLTATAILIAVLPHTAAAKDVNSVAKCEGKSSLLHMAEQRRFEDLDKKLSSIVVDYETGRMDEYDARDALLEVPDAAQACHAPLFDAWIAAKPNSYVAALLRGEFLLNRAWDIIADISGNELTKNQRASIQDAVQAARQEYERSIKLHPRPLFSYDRLISASKLLNDADLARDWVAEANKIAPQNTIVRGTYMHALKPRWGGSYGKMWNVVEEVRKSGAPLMKVSCFERDYATAWMEDGAQDADEIVQVFSMALKGPCRQASDFYERGAAHYRLAAFDHAVSDFDNAIKLEINDKRKSTYAFWRGSSYEQMDQFEKAFADFSLAEKLGNARGALALARFYMFGNAHIARDPRKSLAICERVAKTDTTGEALRCLASHFAEGMGVARDPAKTAQFLRDAAGMGDAISKIVYGDYLWEGAIVQRDRAGAVRMWCEAARDELSDASERLIKHVGIDADAMPHWSCADMAKFSVSPN